jgi:hypothetical protein
VPIEQVTALSALLTLPWAFKFLWAPLVDALRPRRGGLRLWIAGAQVVMGAMLWPVAGIDPESGIRALATFLLLHAVAAATQDVAIDALAVRTTPVHELGAITGWMQVGMLAGRACFGGLALVVEAAIGAERVVLALIALVWGTSALVWLVREAPSEDLGTGRDRWRHFATTARTVLRARTTWLGLALATIGGAAMESTGIVAGPLLVDLGLDKAVVGRFFGGPAVVCMGLGALFGGWLSDRRHARRERFLLEALLAVAAGVAAMGLWLGRSGGDAGWAPLALLSLNYALFGVYTAAAYALFMQLTDPRLGGTQFSAFMSGINLCSVWSGWAVGRLAARWDYPVALVLMAMLSLLGIPLIFAIRRWRARAGSDRLGAPRLDPTAP